MLANGRESSQVPFVFPAQLIYDGEYRPRTTRMGMEASSVGGVCPMTKRLSALQVQDENNN